LAIEYKTRVCPRSMTSITLVSRPAPQRNELDAPVSRGPGKPRNGRFNVDFFPWHHAGQNRRTAYIARCRPAAKQ